MIFFMSNQYKTDFVLQILGILIRRQTKKYLY